MQCQPAHDEIGLLVQPGQCHSVPDHGGDVAHAGLDSEPSSHLEHLGGQVDRMDVSDVWRQRTSHMHRAGRHVEHHIGARRMELLDDPVEPTDREEAIVERRRLNPELRAPRASCASVPSPTSTRSLSANPASLAADDSPRLERHPWGQNSRAPVGPIRVDTPSWSAKHDGHRSSGSAGAAYRDGRRGP